MGCDALTNRGLSYGDVIVRPSTPATIFVNTSVMIDCTSVLLTPSGVSDATWKTICASVMVSESGKASCKRFRARRLSVLGIENRVSNAPPPMTWLAMVLPPKSATSQMMMVSQWRRKHQWARRDNMLGVPLSLVRGKSVFLRLRSPM